ncbi:MAG: ShET2/EspL2 family type III secretion system effector toxin [Candidatus Endonucleobacter bathymodioli]|uniref:ShET2/EspL2 family type III secretion system effector toxin n=1 Tax=Candidatus Endonucleibacter bathymodioli TaxID=539814 RepID=A0AA90NT66_9GAMM|nr:ShET2/EspL2 family type III secretion system effector toxin [Candidatus Endonucleobacter bathymodioli]
MSKGRRCNLNGKVYRDSELVVCRHLSAWWLKLKEFEYGAIDSEEKIAKCKEIPSTEELNKSFHHKVYPSEGIYFETSQFHNVIYDIATSLSEGQEKRYLLGSIVHEMALCIKKNKYNNIIIYYYDPNDHTSTQRVIAKTVGDLKYLHYDDFLEPNRCVRLLSRAR